MPPRVIMDLTFASKSRTGTRVYAERICDALIALGEYQVNPVGNARLEYSRCRSIPQSGNLLTGARNLWWLQVELPRLLAHQRASLIHAAAFLGPLHAPCPMVVNVFDTIYLAYPAEFDYKWRLYARFLIPPTVRRAAMVITLSEYARSQIVQAYGVPHERVRVIPPGVGTEFWQARSLAQISETRARFSLGEHYLLFVGASEPRKNVASLVEALAQLRAQFPDLELALAGPRGGGWQAIREMIARHHLENAVHELGYVPPADLPSLYAGARAFVFPSLTEGFGIPLIEAMASGAPVVAAPSPPTPEVVGDAAGLARGSDAAALADALARVLVDTVYAQELRERGRARAALYTWERAARETAQVYHDVLNGLARILPSSPLAVSERGWG